MFELQMEVLFTKNVFMQPEKEMKLNICVPNFREIS